VAGDDEAAWSPDPYEAILLLHGWTGSVAPDLVALGPTLRRTAGVLGLDFRGHGGSDDAPTTFGLHEVEDVAGALTWLAERGIRRVALAGSSMGGIVAIASIVVLGDGVSLAQADLDPMAPAAMIEAPCPRIVAAVAESVAPDLRIPIANRMPLPIGGPLRRALAGRMFRKAGRQVGGDLRATEPGRLIGLVEIPLLLIHGGADRTVPPKDGRRLAALAGPTVEHWEVAAAGHGGARAAAPAQWDERVSRFLRSAFLGAREVVPIIHTPGEPARTHASQGTEGD
jgi:pimeloyl-ACP methyl ester carboxylesterase